MDKPKAIQLETMQKTESPRIFDGILDYDWVPVAPPIAPNMATAILSVVFNNPVNLGDGEMDSVRLKREGAADIYLVNAECEQVEPNKVTFTEDRMAITIDPI